MSTNQTVPLPANYVDTPKNRSVLVHHVREIMAERGQPGSWQVFDLRDGLAFATRSIPSATGGSIKVTLDPKFSPARMPELENLVAGKGLTITQLRMDLPPAQRYAVASRITPAVKILRDYLAASLGRHQHEIALNAVWSPSGHIEVVWVKGLPGTMPDEKLEGLIQAFIGRLPGGNSNWTVEVDPMAGIGTLTYCKPERLPNLVALGDILPDRVMPEDWYKLTLGEDSNGNVLFHDLYRAPHQLVVGPTGTGKSIALLSLLTSALARGHQFCMIEPIKGGPDYMPLYPYATAWAETLPSAQRALELIYAEAMRRKAVVKGQYQKRKWSDLPADILAKHDIQPMTVLIDEYGSLSEMEETYKSLPKDHELNIEANEINTHKAIIKGLTRKLARESRSWGIHLQIALQRPTAEELGSGLRAQLTGRTQLVPPNSGVSKTDLGLVFTADAVESATERITTLDHGGRLGLAVIQGESGLTRGLRVAYCSEDELVPLMEKIGVPRVTKKWDVGGEPVTNPDVLLTDPDYDPDSEEPKNEDDQFPPLSPDDSGDFPF